MQNKTKGRNKNTHSIHVDRRQIIRIGVRRRLGTGGIESARNLQELFSAIIYCQRGFQRSIGTVRSRVAVSNLICLCLQGKD